MARTYLVRCVGFLVIFPLILLHLEVHLFDTFRQIWSLLTLTFVSGSSLVSYHLIEDLKKQGHDEHVIDLVVPLGYTFNLERGQQFTFL